MVRHWCIKFSDVLNEKLKHSVNDYHRLYFIYNTPITPTPDNIPPNIP